MFADWLIDPKNPWFTRNIANRVWAWLVGRGIIHEPDDIRPDNPPSNPELLALLEQELIASHYDLKQLYRLILNSKTYQLSSVPKADSPEGDANFSHYPLRRVDAEVLIDALDKITGGTENYSSAIPEPFTYIPENLRSIALPDGSITSSFLDMFGRPSRDTGLESERNNRPTADQRLHLLNSSQIQRKIEQSPMIKNLVVAGKDPRDIATGMYLGILSRFPTEEELKIVEGLDFPNLMTIEAMISGESQMGRDHFANHVWEKDKTLHKQLFWPDSPGESFDFQRLVDAPLVIMLFSSPFATEIQWMLAVTENQSLRELQYQLKQLPNFKLQQKQIG